MIATRIAEGRAHVRQHGRGNALESSSSFG